MNVYGDPFIRLPSGFDGGRRKPFRGVLTPSRPSHQSYLAAADRIFPSTLVHRRGGPIPIFKRPGDAGVKAIHRGLRQAAIDQLLPVPRLLEQPGNLAMQAIVIEKEPCSGRDEPFLFGKASHSMPWAVASSVCQSFWSRKRCSGLTGSARQAVPARFLRHF
jgi:hypothetical protein